VRLPAGTPMPVSAPFTGGWAVASMR
jgi:hypothetical protein